MSESMRIGPFTVHPDRNYVEHEDNLTTIEPKAMEVLCYLAHRAGEVCTKEEIFEAVWGNVFVTDEALTNAISKLRSALGDQARAPRFIRTIPRRGYCLIAPVDTAMGIAPNSRYQIERKLASGIVGEIYKARDLQLRRPVAVKILSPELSTNEDARRILFREARRVGSA